jgi:hypothetical protein
LNYYSRLEVVQLLNSNDDNDKHDDDKHDDDRHDDDKGQLLCQEEEEEKQHSFQVTCCEPV